MTGTALLVDGTAARVGAADEVTGAAEEGVGTGLDWILDATPPTACVAAVAGVAGFRVAAAEVYASATRRLITMG